MSISNKEKSETRSLAAFIQAKLGITLAKFAKMENTPVGTLNNRWYKVGGKRIVMDAVKRIYIDRYNDL